MITYIGPETGLKKNEINSLNTVLVQEKNDFDNRVSNIKREKSYVIESGFFKPSGPISDVKSVRVRLRDRSYTTVYFRLDTNSFPDQVGDIFLGTVDEMGTNINGIGYVLVNDSPLQFLKGKFGFVTRASGLIELIYRSDNDTASIFTVNVSWWNEVSNV